MRLILLVSILLLCGCTAEKAAPSPAPTPQPVVGYEVLAFKASWCGPCRVNEPRVKKLGLKDYVSIREVDVDNDHETAGRYSIFKLPTYVVLRAGAEIRRTSDIDELESWFQ